MILSSQSLRRLRPIDPFVERTVDPRSGMSFGLSACGYDLRIAQEVIVRPGHFVLASTIERFTIPINVMCMIKDKSSWARQGLAVQNTVAEPGWRGWLTLELSNHGREPIGIFGGTPIAQAVFMWLDEATDSPYTGKYQDAPPGPTPAKREGE